MTTINPTLLFVNYKALVSVQVINPRVVRCTFRNMFTNKEFVVMLVATLDQIKSWVNGTTIQVALGHLSKDVRELFLTGMANKDFGTLLESL